MNLNKTIAWATSLLVLSVAIGSFVLSFHALQGIASTNGLNGWLTYVWPLLIDLSMIVFSLCVVTAHLYSESVWKQWTLVGIYTIATCAFNWLHAPDSWLAHAVAIVPPISLFFSFELLMSQLKNGVKRSQTITTLSAWDNALIAARQGFSDLQAQTNILLADRDNRILELTNQLDIARNPVAHRRRVVHLERQGDNPTPYKELAERFNVSEQTIKGDMVSYQNGVGK